MAVTDPYATASEYRTGISPNKTDTASDGEIDRDLFAVQGWLEQRLGRFFGVDDEFVARYFYGAASGAVHPEAENPYKFAGAASRVLHLDADLVEVDTIDTDDGGTNTFVAWEGSDYQLLPLNAAAGPEPRPYNAVFVPTWSTKSGWPPGRQVRIFGKWGWPAVPASIKRGVINLTALLRLETPAAISRVDALGTITTANREARSIVDDLVRVYAKPSF